MPRATPSAGRYELVESLHLRQWALRAVLPLAVLATNGAGLLDITCLPNSTALGIHPSVAVALRAAGAALVLGAVALRVAAKGVLVRRTTLTVCGVYGIVRHPFYLANLLGAVGTFFLAGPLGALVAAAWLAAALPLYAVTIAGEEAGLANLYEDEFRRYAATVPALLPRRLRSGEPARVTWANLRAEREPPRLMRFVAGAAAVAALTFHGPAAAVALGAAAALFACSYFVR